MLPTTGSATDDDIPPELRPPGCPDGYACLTKADLQELVRRRTTEAVSEATADLRVKYEACRVDLGATEQERDACGGGFAACREEADRLRSENASLASSAASSGVSWWLPPSLATLGGAAASGGVWCALDDSCPLSTAIVIEVGAVAGVVLGYVLE